MTEGALQPVTEWTDLYGRTDKKDTINAIIEAIAQVNPKGSFAVGDILYASTVGKMALLPKGTNGHFLQQGATIPAWAAAGDANWNSDNSPAVTRFLAIGAHEVAAGAIRENTNTLHYVYDGTNRWADSSTQAVSMMGVHLPHGAIVTALRVTAQESSSTNLSVSLRRDTHASGGSVDSMASVSITTTLTELSDTSISNATINNNTHYYFINFNISSTIEVRIRAIQIDYTVVRPQP